eukprot:g7421.t1
MLCEYGELQRTHRGLGGLPRTHLLRAQAREKKKGSSKERRMRIRLRVRVQFSSQSRPSPRKRSNSSCAMKKDGTPLVTLPTFFINYDNML